MTYVYDCKHIEKIQNSIIINYNFINICVLCLCLTRGLENLKIGNIVSLPCKFVTLYVFF